MLPVELIPQNLYINTGIDKFRFFLYSIIITMFHDKYRTYNIFHL